MHTGDRRDVDGARWCTPCGHYHGPLYVCDAYPPELRAEVRGASDQQVANLRDPKWIAEQRAAGVPQMAIDFMRMFAGVEVP